MDVVNTIALKNHTLQIVQDDSAESPREWDNLGTMVCFHKRYNFGDEHDYQSGNFGCWTELRNQITKDHDPAIILPLFLMDHSGLSISYENESFRACDSVGWDWGQLGYIFVSKEKARKEYSKSRLSKKTLARIEEVLKAEIKVYDQYLNGDVYGFILTDGEGNEDSCWGFYGDNPLENGMVDHFPEEVQKELKEKFPVNKHCFA